ncbi:MADS-box protein defh21 [Quercus robur]|uniref:MADS-box protein defh21 n=1 Tax=Quercus robur TaxID=38942 RepID=UPI0021614748|nr:MADS-box protein defh21 [Quercus robur]
MGRRRVSISRIENRTTRQVTFAKRRVGLFKKTHELSVLCDAQIGIMVFSSSGKLYEYCSDASGMEHIIRRYKIATGTDQIPESNDQLEQIHGELKRMQRETLSLELSLQRYTGEDLNSVQFGDLHELEQKLENSVNKVRERMFELLQQQTDNLRRKGKMLHDENENLYHLLKENQVALDHQAELDQHQQMTVVHKTEDRRHVLESFPFSGEEQPSSVLTQATLPPLFNPYRLQPTQPNLQDFSLQLPDYGTSMSS